MEASFLKNKVVLVTGGAGSIGSQIVSQLIEYEPAGIRIFDNDENGLFNLLQELRGHKDYIRLRFLVGDIRDKYRLNRAMEGVNIVFHAAALKHVPLCEYNPFDAVETNVLGTQNVLNAALDRNVNKTIVISTDKAANPISTMGATKLLAERLAIDANTYTGYSDTLFSCVRFGNVLGSRGSIIPFLEKQLSKGGPVTITDPNMTRFVMNSSVAIDLVLRATEIAQGGEIFIFKMPALKMNDLIEVAIEKLASKYGYKAEEIKIEKIGLRPGEKIHEELMTKDELERALESPEMFVLLSYLSGIGKKRVYKLPDCFKKIQAKTYSSENAKLLTKEEIRLLLNDLSPKKWTL